MTQLGTKPASLAEHRSGQTHLINFALLRTSTRDHNGCYFMFLEHIAFKNGQGHAVHLIQPSGEQRTSSLVERRFGVLRPLALLPPSLVGECSGGPLDADTVHHLDDLHSRACDGLVSE